MFNKFLFLIQFILLALFVAPLALAHPGNTDALGCHTCRTNCSSWGLSYGEYHCHNSKGYTQPSNPINSHWGDNGTGYTTPAPSYSPSIFNDSLYYSCPSHSTYSVLKDSCQCNHGYVANEAGTGCISENNWCENKYGWFSNYSSLDNACQCDYGYVFDKDIFGDIKCVDGNSYCHDLYGYNSRYNSLSEECECSYGYFYNGNTCIRENDFILDNGLIDDYFDDLLQNEKCGLNSHITSDDQCVCDTGYVWENVEDESNLTCIKKNCSEGLILVNNICITHTANCQTSYGNNVFGITDNEGGSMCYCNDGFVWSDDGLTCIKEVAEIQEVIIPSSVDKTGDFITRERNKLLDIDEKLSERLKGKILLQVEDHGEAWYISPVDKKRYYMANGEEAYSIMRNLGVGITNSDLDKIKKNKDFAQNYSGKIFLQVEDLGQAYYIDFEGNSHYLKDGQAAYNIMRSLGLGASNNDLRKIDIFSR